MIATFKPRHLSPVSFLLMIGITILVQSSALAADATSANAGSRQPVTFSKDVAPILQEKCQECHQPNSIAPMSLISYKESRPWARSIRERVITRQMPPWHIDRSVGVQKFKNDMSLTDEQVSTIVRCDGYPDTGAVNAASEAAGDG